MSKKVCYTPDASKCPIDTHGCEVETDCEGEPTKIYWQLMYGANDKPSGGYWREAHGSSYCDNNICRLYKSVKNRPDGDFCQVFPDWRCYLPGSSCQTGDQQCKSENCSQGVCKPNKNIYYLIALIVLLVLISIMMKKNILRIMMYFMVYSACIWILIFNQSI